MVKGLGTGMLSGGIVGAIVMSGLSLYAPLQQDRIDAAPKLEATQTKPDTAATTQGTPTVAPEQSAALVAATEQSASVAPTASGQATPKVASENAQAVEAPVVPSVVTGETNTATAQAAIDTQSTTPVASSETASNAASKIVAAQDTSVTAEAAPSVVAEVDASLTAPTDDATPSLGGNETSATRVQPSGLASPRLIGEEQVEAEAPTQTAALAAPKPASSLPRITTPVPATEGEPVSADTPIVLPTPSVPGVVTNRLPSVGGIAAATPAPAAVEIAPEVEESLGALAQFASTVEGIEGKSLMSFVLIDSGEDGVARADLAALAIPVTIAIDPVMENAAAIMAEYRAAGIEVVAIANDLPVAAGPGDVATAVSAYFDVLNQSVALMDPLDARIQSNRSLLQPVLGAIRNTGHGLITYDRGLNTAQQAAKRESIPAATVFRVLDADLEEAPKIKRYLDRAAFAANQDGAVVLVGRSYPDTVQALVEWSLEKKDASIAIVPVSAIMLAGGS